VRGTGYELVVYSAGRRTVDVAGWERRYLARLGGTLIEGAVLVTPTVVDASVGIPVVAVDPHTGDSSVPIVDSDNLRGARLATHHLIGLGHRRIGFIAGRHPEDPPGAAADHRTAEEAATTRAATLTFRPIRQGRSTQTRAG
jgi:LacI family transcriptional regulator